jgi:hypothetical protein
MVTATLNGSLSNESASMGASKLSHARSMIRGTAQQSCSIIQRVPGSCSSGHETLIEVCAGRLEGEDAESRIIKEAEEETGFIVQNPQRIFEAYTSPGCFAEKITFFIAEYTPGSQITKGAATVRARTSKSCNLLLTKL